MLRLRKIHGLATKSIGCPVGPATEYEADLLVEKLKQVHNQIQKTGDLKIFVLNFLNIAICPLLFTYYSLKRKSCQCKQVMFLPC